MDAQRQAVIEQENAQRAAAETTRRQALVATDAAERELAHHCAKVWRSLLLLPVQYMGIGMTTLWLSMRGHSDL